MFPWFSSRKRKVAYAQLLSETRAARLDYYRRLGTPDETVWAVTDEAELQQSAWPTRPAWRRIVNADQTIIVSDGLSDPWPDAARGDNGFGLEILVASADSLPVDLQSSWLFHIAWHVAQNAAVHGKLADLLKQHQVGVLDIVSNPALAEMANEAGQIGIFLGLHTQIHHERIPLPSGEVLLITAKLLTRSEFAYAQGNQAIGTHSLRERFLTDGTTYTSSLTRRSVI